MMSKFHKLQNLNENPTSFNDKRPTTLKILSNNKEVTQHVNNPINSFSLLKENQVKNGKIGDKNFLHVTTTTITTKSYHACILGFRTLFPLFFVSS